jgi:putative transposase
VYARQCFGLSERKACELIRLNRSTFQYVCRQKDEEEIRNRIRKIANRHKRYGSPMIHARLRREGFMINHKKTERIYREEGLTLRRKIRKKLPADRRGKMPYATRPGEIWSMDFVSDSLTYGRKFRALTIVDDFTKVCPGIFASTSIPGSRVAAYMDMLAKAHGYPEWIRTDNGPEIIGRDFVSWAQKRGIQLSYSRPGKPTDNAYIESFNGKFRDDCLNQHWLSNLKEAQQIIENWRREYNEIRPHSTLGYCTPNEFARKHQDMVNNNSLASNLA